MHLPTRTCFVLYVFCLVLTIGFVSLNYKTTNQSSIRTFIPSTTYYESSNTSFNLNKCNDKRIPSYRTLGKLFRRDEILNYLGFILRSHSLFYCSVPKVATRTLLLFVTYLHIRDDLIPSLSNNPKLSGALNISSLNQIIFLTTKNVSQTIKLDSISLLKLFLTQLEFRNSSKIDLWSIYQKKIFPSIRLRSVLNPSIIFSPNYLRVIFVRHPLERFASAYIDKIASLKQVPFTLYDYTRRAVCRKFSSFYLTVDEQNLYTTNKGLEKEIDEPCQKIIPTFEHFIEYFMLNNIKGDVHWRPYSNLCHVCLIKYNFIGKFETIEEDLQRIVKYLGLNSSEWIKDDHFQSGKTKENYKLMYSNLDDKFICYLKKFYENDLKLFDYQIEDYLLLNRTIRCSTKYIIPRF